MLLEIAKIKATPEAQPRVSLNYPMVEQYAEALRGGAEFPPVVVFFDGCDHWLADGFHRVEAYKADDRTKIPVDVRSGTKRDAILYSVGANAKHGLPRTNEDKRRAVEVLLKDAEWGKWTDQQIAEAAGVGREFANRLRRELIPTCDRITSSEKRLGRDGKWRRLPQKTRPKTRPLTDEETEILGDLSYVNSVYVLQDADLIKVGWSRHPKERVQSLLTGRPDATIVAIAAGSQAQERAVHKLLECERECGEWFCASIDEVFDAMVKCGLSPRSGKTRKLPERKSDPAPKADAPEEKPRREKPAECAPERSEEHAPASDPPPEPRQAKEKDRLWRPEDFPTINERDTMNALINALRVAREFPEKSWSMVVRIVNHEVGVREYGYKEEA